MKLIIVAVLLWVATVEGRRSVRQVGFLDLTARVERCTTPTGAPGVCLGIRKCSPLLDLLVTRGRQPDVAQYLRRSVCGYNGDGPIVCCPRTNGVTTAPTERPSGTPPTQPQRTSVTPEPDSESPDLLPTPGQCGLSPNSNLRIVGGVNASLGDWPWLVALGYKSKRNPNSVSYLCGGSIITKYHILTAAHCMKNNKPITVRVGEYNMMRDDDGADPVDMAIAEVLLHENYSPTTYTDDIALIRLVEPIKFTRLVKPVCLPLAYELRTNSFTNSLPFVAGWGSMTYGGINSEVVQHIQVPVLDLELCQKAFSRFTAVIDTRVICAGYLKGGMDACKGDSGGPLMVNEFTKGQAVFYQIGVVSYGYRCAEPGYPGVYTRVTAYTDWILRNLK